MRKLALFLVLFFLQTILVPAQEQAVKPQLQKEGDLKKEVLAFLRETSAEVNNLRLLTNRISFSAELASLMWFHDEKQARAMYTGIIAEYRELLAKYDADLNNASQDNDEASPTGFLSDPTTSMMLERRMRSGISVGQQISMSMVDHDAELAYNFYFDSLSVITNPLIRTQLENADTYFESQLLELIIKNDPNKAAPLAARSLARGMNSQHIELLRKLYAKSPEKGIEFGASILSHLKTKTDKSASVWVMGQLLELADGSLQASRSGSKKPVFDQSEMRQLSEIVASRILAQDPKADVEGLAYMDVIRKHSPARAAQIKAKFGYELPSAANSSTRNHGGNTNSSLSTESELPAPAVSGNTAVSSNRHEDRLKAEKQLLEDVGKVGSNSIPKEEREKIVAQARRIIAQTPGRDKKIVLLSSLAGQVADAGDKQLASEIMKDAAALVSPTPKHYQDFMLTWMLAAGYAKADPDRAFTLLEDTIGRANDTIAAAIKVAEFIDVSEEMVQDGELQVGSFGGSMIRGLTGELVAADSAIQMLAASDFGKTKTLTDRFDRAEVRMLAKLMVIRAVLQPKKATTTEVDPDELTDTE